MGTYTTLVLKNISKATEINKILVDEFGDAYHGTFEGVNYGAFYSREMLAEDLRFCNEDPEGLKQNTHIKRPLNKRHFMDLGFILGQFFVKISSLNVEELRRVRAIQKWLKEDNNIEFIRLEKSINVDRLLDYPHY